MINEFTLLTTNNNVNFHFSCSEKIQDFGPKVGSAEVGKKLTTNTFVYSKIQGHKKKKLSKENTLNTHKASAAKAVETAAGGGCHKLQCFLWLFRIVMAVGMK